MVGPTPLGNSGKQRHIYLLCPSRGKEDAGFIHQIPVCYWMREAARALTFWFFWVFPYARCTCHHGQGKILQARRHRCSHKQLSARRGECQEDEGSVLTTATQSNRKLCSRSEQFTGRGRGGEARQHMKRHSTSFIKKCMKTQPAFKYHFSLHRWARIQEFEHTFCGWGWGSTHSHASLLGVQTGTTPRRAVRHYLSKLKMQS